VPWTHDPPPCRVVTRFAHEQPLLFYATYRSPLQVEQDLSTVAPGASPGSAQGSPAEGAWLAVGLQRLELLVWPSAPPLARHVLSSVSPRVRLAEALPVPRGHVGPAAARRGEGMARVGVGAGEVRAGAPCGAGADVGRAKMAAGGAPRVAVLHRGTPLGGGSATGGSLRGGGGGSQGGGGGSQGGSERAAQQGRGRYVAPHARPTAPAGVELPPEPGEERPAVAPAVQAAAAAREAAAPGPSLRPPGAAAEGPRGGLRAGVERAGSVDGELRAGGVGAEGQLDDCLAALVAPSAWEDLDGSARAGPAQREELHIAERFRRAYEEQDARLRAKAAREAAVEERRRLAQSGAERELGRWMDASGGVV
jgi:hypothetical protein